MFLHSIKKASIYSALTCILVLSACSTGHGLVGFKSNSKKTLNAESAPNPENQRCLQEPNSGKISQQGEPSKLGCLKYGESALPDYGKNPNTLPVKTDQKEKESAEPEKPEQLNLRTSGKIPEPDTGEFTTVETGDVQAQPPVPELKINPDFLAPEKFQHSLQFSNKQAFMLGQDDKGYYLYSEGPIITGAYDRFIRYVAHYESIGIKLDRLMMHSPGGKLAEGIQIGQFVRDRKWSTDLDKHMRCYSSCAMIYAAGVEKRMQDGAQVGFHRPYIPGKPDTPEFVRQVYQDYKPYWSSLQGDPDFYDDFMSNYGRDNMLVLTTETAPKHMRIEKY